jgi:hypothetical protein
MTNIFNTKEKSRSKMLATFVIKKLPKVNNPQLGDNSPNLVTLLATYLGIE